MTSRKGKDGAPLIQEFYQPDYSHTAPRAEGEAPTAPSGGSYCMGRALLLTTKGAPVLSSMLARAVTWAAWVRSGRVQEM